MKSTRAQAIKHYEPRYDTKKPCKQGHLSPRDTITSQCLLCRKAWSKKTQDQVKALRQQFNAVH
jgi:hypothetical protein